ncbi:hypothetical protein N9L92_02685, partial [Saprospiraceae bacterium]|nr:hypothetical protein [Saprospiraceae bacterium]
DERHIPSVRQLALKISVHPQCMSDIMTGKRSVNSDIIHKCAQHFDINLNYLYRGHGGMMIDEPCSDSIDISGSGKDLAEHIAYVPIEAQAGYVDQFHENVYVDELVTFSLPDPRYNHGSYRCFDVSGDSMEPSIYSGDKLICQNVEQQYWMSSIKNNYVYIIISNEGVVVKRVINRINEDGILRLVSDNSFYHDIDLFIGDIKEVWLVTSKISTFMQSPNNIRNGLDKVVETLKDTITDQSKMIQSLNGTIEKLLRQNRVSRV